MAVFVCKIEYFLFKKMVVPRRTNTLIPNRSQCDGHRGLASCIDSNR